MTGIGEFLSRKRPILNRSLVAGYVVRERATGRIVHREMAEVGHLSDNKAANKMMKRCKQLERIYSPAQYEVEDGIFSSEAAFDQFSPEF